MAATQLAYTPLSSKTLTLTLIAPTITLSAGSGEVLLGTGKVTINEWSIEAHIALLADLMPNTTMALQAYCNDRSAAAINLATHALVSNTLALSLTDRSLTCTELENLLKASDIEYKHHSSIPCTDTVVAESTVATREVMQAFRSDTLMEYITQVSQRQGELSIAARVKGDHASHLPEAGARSTKLMDPHRLCMPCQRCT